MIPAFWYQPFDPANLQAQGAPVWRVRFTPPTAGQWQALTLQSPTEASLWLRSDAYSADVAQQAHQQAILKALKSKQKLTTWQYTLRPLHGLTIQLSQLDDGAYRVKWFSPQTGAWLNSTPVVVKNGPVTLNAPDFDRDLAGKLVKTP